MNWPPQSPSDLAATCIFSDPLMGMCGLPDEHDGPHGWDYEAGEPRWITLKMVRPMYARKGLAHVIDRAWALMTGSDATDKEQGSD